MDNNDAITEAPPQAVEKQNPTAENSTPATGEQPISVTSTLPFAAAPNANHSPERREQSLSVPIDTTALPTNLLSSLGALRDVQTLFGIAEPCKCFLGPNGIANVRYWDVVAGRPIEEVAAVRSEQFGRWLNRMFFFIKRRPVVSEALQAVVDVLEARATRRNKRSPETHPCHRDDAAPQDFVTDDAQFIEPEYVSDVELGQVDNEFAVFTHASLC